MYYVTIDAKSDAQELAYYETNSFFKAIKKYFLINRKYLNKECYIQKMVISLFKNNRFTTILQKTI